MVIKLDGLSEKEKKAQLEFAFLFPKSFELIKEEGRVEGFDLKIDEAMDKSNWSNARERSLVKVSELSPRGKTILVKALENHLKYLKAQNGLF